MTKATLVREISKKTGIEKKVAMQTVEAMMKIIKGTMTEGENVYLRGFGSFILKRRAQKLGRIITQNKTIVVPAHNIAAFKAAKTFANKIKHVKAKGKKKVAV